MDGRGNGDANVDVDEHAEHDEGKLNGFTMNVKPIFCFQEMILIFKVTMKGALLIFVENETMVNLMKSMQ